MLVGAALMNQANPRAVCIQALRRWNSTSEFADDILHEMLAAHPMSMVDRPFFMEIFYGILRNLSLLDFIIARYRDQPLDDFTRQVLRLGIYQIFRMRVPPHAAVNETVNLAGRARGLVNAILRQALRDESQLGVAIENAPEEVRFSHPVHLIDRWRTRFGGDNARQLCSWNNEPAEMFVRVNGLKVTRGELLRSSKDAEPLSTHPGMLKVRQVPFLWIAGGLCYVQDPSTLLSCELLDPQPGEVILDACAAPGGKSSYIAELMQNSGKLVACDISEERVLKMRENLRRLGVENAEIQRVDWLRTQPFPQETFDRILLDAPCSNTGVIRRRVDVRWRLKPDDFLRMQEKQLQIFRRLVPLIKKGGVIVYSSCSLEPEENEGLAARALKEIPGLALLEKRQSTPFDNQIDGAFAAKFQRIE
jgi:16S rRNA (cytosine967-C5)-methyltransferase